MQSKKGHVQSFFPGGASSKETACQCSETQRCRFDPCVGKTPWRNAWQALQYSCLENPMYRRIWWATVHRVKKRRVHLNSRAHVHSELLAQCFSVPSTYSYGPSSHLWSRSYLPSPPQEDYKKGDDGLR